ncbi:hypothetical protein [Spirosoma flavum]|uniref:Uncharacterized protein n=1 Tax=Spirosoma flavum TaxID=2048557 RepID=A0ABW6ASW9_9BACT
MIKVGSLIKWLPICLASVGVFLYAFSGRNFAHNLFTFIIGDSYNLVGLSLAILWLTCLVWVIIKGRQIETSEGESSGSLFKIASVREHHLLHVSATPYNEQSRQVIARFNPDPAKGQEKDNNKGPAVKQEHQNNTSITGNFPNNGKKKEQSKEVAKEAETNTEDNKKSAPDSKPAEVSNKPTDSIDKGPLADVNTSIKGVSLLDEEKANKIKGRLKFYGPKRKEPQEN